jgi:hypothetical protein
MKRSHLRHFLFGFAFLCSLVSYVYLNTQQAPAASPQEKELTGMEQNQEVVLPDMVFVKKLVDASKIFTSFARN